jgi:splicing factor 3B subunit 3
MQSQPHPPPLKQVVDLAHEDSRQIYALCGRGTRSTLRVLRHGLSVSEVALSELPGDPTAVWTVKGSNRGAPTPPLG